MSEPTGTSHDAPAKPSSSADLPVTAAGRARSVTLILQDGSTWTDEGLADFSAYLSQQFAIRVEAEARQASLTAPLAAPADPLATRESAPLDVERLREVLPQALSDAEPSMSDAADWEGSEYVYNLGEAIAAAYAAATGSADPVATTDEEGAERG